MSLERTNYGLNNEHLFYDVSLIVYCEGKENDGSTHDEMFWTKVLSSFGISCVCKSRGSKPNIVPLALRAIEGDVKNIAFALDKDYGDYCDQLIKDRRVIYTYGYSWENDILLGLNASSAFSMFAPVINGDDVERDLAAFVTSVSDSAVRITCMDIRNVSTSVALFDRDKPVSIFVGAGSGLRFNEELVSEKFMQIAASEAVADVQELPDDWIRVFYGKACARFIYQWFVDRSQAHSNRSKIPYDAFLRLCISMMDLRPEINARNRYYCEAVAGLA